MGVTGIINTVDILERGIRSPPAMQHRLQNQNVHVESGKGVIFKLLGALNSFLLLNKLYEKMLS